MREHSKILYHLNELEIANDPDSPHHVMPRFYEKDHDVLDIGCGIGQTFIASSLRRDKNLVGIDVDGESLSYGRRNFNFIHFARGTGDCLPFKSNSFDCVISRVSLPYTNIPKALLEIKRVLKNKGRVWFTLIPLSLTLLRLKKTILNFRVKEFIFLNYVIANGILFSLFGKVLAFPVGKKYESFQSELGIRRALENAGFLNINIQRKKSFIFVVTAES